MGDIARDLLVTNEAWRCPNRGFESSKKALWFRDRGFESSKKALWFRDRGCVGVRVHVSSTLAIDQLIPHPVQ